MGFKKKKKNLYFALPIKYTKTCVYDNLIDMYEFVRFEKQGGIGHFNCDHQYGT